MLAKVANKGWRGQPATRSKTLGKLQAGKQVRRGHWHSIRQGSPIDRSRDDQRTKGHNLGATDCSWRRKGALLNRSLPAPARFLAFDPQVRGSRRAFRSSKSPAAAASRNAAWLRSRPAASQGGPGRTSFYGHARLLAFDARNLGTHTQRTIAATQIGRHQTPQQLLDQGVGDQPAECLARPSQFHARQKTPTSHSARLL